jgi:hypothetical protein
MINEIIFSMSYNGEPEITPDLVSRSRRVHLSKPASPTNKHSFKTQNLHSLLYSWEPLDKKSAICRENVLAALLSLVVNWVDKNTPPGKTFTSFPEWAETVGGIMEAADLGDITTLSARDFLKIEDARINAFLRFAFWFAHNAVPCYTASEFLQIMTEHDKQHPDQPRFLEITATTTPVALGSALAKAARREAYKGHPSIVGAHCRVHASGLENASYQITFKEGFTTTYLDFLDIFEVPSEDPKTFLIKAIPSKSPESPDPDANHE